MDYNRQIQQLQYVQQQSAPPMEGYGQSAPYAPQPASQSQQNTIQEDMEQLRIKAEGLGLKASEFGDLQQLYNYDVYVILDDSSSMLTPGVQDPFNRYNKITRWQEQLNRLDDIAEVLQYVDPDGYQLVYLNDPNHNDPQRNPFIIRKNDMPDDPKRRGFKVPLSQTVLKDAQQNGVTPMIRTLKNVFRHCKNVDQGLQGEDRRKKLIIVLTDGVPSDGGIHDIRQMVKDPYMFSDNMHIQFCMCTENDELVEDYNRQIDRDLKRTDVIDDYQSEQQEVYRNRGDRQGREFTRMRYTAKVLLGAINRRYGKMDEKPMGCFSCFGM